MLLLLAHFSPFLFPFLLFPLSATETHTQLTRLHVLSLTGWLVLALPYLVCCTLWKQQQQSKLLRLFFSKDVTLNWLKKKRGKADKKCVCVEKSLNSAMFEMEMKMQRVQLLLCSTNEKLWCHRIIGQVSVHSRHARARESTAKEGSLAACSKHCSREDTASVSLAGWNVIEI